MALFYKDSAPTEQVHQSASNREYPDVTDDKILEHLPLLNLAAMIPFSTDQLYRPETPEEARTAVREIVAGHSDFVKIWVDDLLGTSPKMKPEIYTAVIDEAHRAGVRVAAHIYYLQDAKAVIRAGADIIAHGVRDQPVDAEFIDEMKAHSTWYVATINLDECSYIRGTTSLD
jgi:imidazolonepropionase-like amidohydrolase